MLALLLYLSLRFSLVASAPDPHEVRVTVTAPEFVVRMAVCVQNDDYESCSQFDRRAVQTTMTFRSVPSGEYRVMAMGKDERGKLVQAAPRMVLVR